MTRNASCPPACETATGCPKGHWSNPTKLQPRHLEAWQHYRECKATNTFPDDPLVRQHAAIFAAAEEAARQGRIEAQTDQILALLTRNANR